MGFFNFLLSHKDGHKIFGVLGFYKITKIYVKKGSLYYKNYRRLKLQTEFDSNFDLFVLITILTLLQLCFKEN